MQTLSHVTDAASSAAVAGRPSAVDPGRTLAVTATYLLSEAGRKASLLAGGNGHALQDIVLQVPPSRLHLVSVDRHGAARLKLRPRFERDDQERVLRIDTAPTYDAPPSLEDLYRAAARNHELEQTHEASRSAQRAQRRETEREWRDRIAQAFLEDTSQRAIAHPPPSLKRCALVTDRGRLLFDVGTDQGRAKEVPQEAHRRFRADLRAKGECNRQQRADQLAQHEQKKQYIADWILTHGTPEQQARQTAGVLPMQEGIEAMTDHALAALRDHTVYQRDGAERLQAWLRHAPPFVDVIIPKWELVVASANAVTATKDQWGFVQQIQAAVPEASVALRVHKLAWKDHPKAPVLTVYGALVTLKVGPLSLRREYAMADASVSDRADRRP